MSKRVCFFHTGAILAPRFDELSKEYIPKADVFHMVDESLIDDLISVGELTPSIIKRLSFQLSLAVDAGAVLILDTCSSTSPGVDVARKLVDVPIIKIDDPMMEKAVDIGKNIGLLATANSTLKPSSELVKRKAKQIGKDITLNSTLKEEAFEALMEGNEDLHDRLVTEKGIELAQDNDVLVLAQASMSHLSSKIAEQVTVPVLTSPELAMEAVANKLEKLS